MNGDIQSAFLLNEKRGVVLTGCDGFQFTHKPVEFPFSSSSYFHNNSVIQKDNIFFSKKKTSITPTHDAPQRERNVSALDTCGPSWLLTHAAGDETGQKKIHHQTPTQMQKTER